MVPSSSMSVCVFNTRLLSLACCEKKKLRNVFFRNAPFYASLPTITTHSALSSAFCTVSKMLRSHRVPSARCARATAPSSHNTRAASRAAYSYSLVLINHRRTSAPCRTASLTNRSPVSIFTRMSSPQHICTRPTRPINDASPVVILTVVL